MSSTEASYTEAEKQYLENADIDTAILFKEIKALRSEVQELKGGMKHEKTAAQKKAAILNIKDTSKRLKAIEENIDLFRQEEKR